jgi:hypothetical protein
VNGRAAKKIRRAVAEVRELKIPPPPYRRLKRRWTETPSQGRREMLNNLVVAAKTLAEHVRAKT